MKHLLISYFGNIQKCYFYKVHVKDHLLVIMWLGKHLTSHTSLCF